MKAGNRATERTRTLIRQTEVLASGTVLAGRYRLVRLLGVGGMGMVYQAEDQRLGLTVAIKVLRSGGVDDRVLRSRFRLELLAGRQISHQGVVRIHDLDQDGELSFLTMDYVPGRSLSELLAEEVRLPLERALAIQCQLAAALAAAHREGVVHRDLKPANILLDAHGDAHITDFGIALTLSSGGLTQTGDVLGTPEYLAPEQAEGRPVDHRADIYALGLILFRMVTGEFAFQGDHVGERLAQRLSGEPRRLSQAGVKVPDYLEAVVARSLARDPADRYQSAEDLLADLEARRSPPVGAWSISLRYTMIAGFLILIASGLAAVVLHPMGLSAGLAATLGEDIKALPSQETLTSRDAPRHALAVLPLARPGPESVSPWGWLPAALPDMLTSSLSESPDLRVVDSLRVARTLEDLRLPTGPLPEAELRLLAELLDVDRIVLGRVWTTGDGAHAELRLVDPSNPQTALLLLQKDASGDEVKRLPARLSEDLRRHLEARPPIHPGAAASSPAALVAYADGLLNLSRGDSLDALPLLERAVQEEPTFTAAWVSLARTYRSLGQRQKALDAARQAVEQSTAEAGRPSFEARAQLATLRGEPEQAQELLKELVEQYPHDVEARVMLAEAYGDAGEYEQADRILEEVVAADPLHPRAWYLRGKYAILTGSVRRAADEYLVRALVVQNRLESAQGRADVLNALGAAHQKLGELDHAEERYSEAVDIRRQIGDRRGTSATLSNLATIQRLRGRFDEARASLEEALSICREVGYREGAADVENDLGILEEQRGLYPRALEHFRNALAMRREGGDLRALAESYGNVGFAYFVLGEYENAGLHWQEALALYQKAGHRLGEALTRQSVAQLAMIQGSWEESLEANLGVLELGREMALPQLTSVATAHLGRVAQLRGRYAASLDSYRAAMDLLDGLEDLRGRTELSLFQADALLEIGLADRAMERLEQADPWLQSTGDREQRAQRLRLEAEIRRARGQLTQSRELLAQAGVEARASGARVIQLEIDLSLGRLDLAAGKPERAARVLRPVLQSAERLGHAVLRTEAGAALAAAERAAGRPEAAENTVRRALEVAFAFRPMAIEGRLHLLLAGLLEARGASAEAGEELDRARLEVNRLRQDLDPDQRAAFDRLPEVQEIERRSPA